MCAFGQKSLARCPKSATGSFGRPNSTSVLCQLAGPQRLAAFCLSGEDIASSVRLADLSFSSIAAAHGDEIHTQSILVMGYVAFTVLCPLIQFLCVLL